MVNGRRGPVKIWRRLLFKSPFLLLKIVDKLPNPIIDTLRYQAQVRGRPESSRFIRIRDKSDFQEYGCHFGIPDNEPTLFAPAPIRHIGAKQALKTVQYHVGKAYALMGEFFFPQGIDDGGDGRRTVMERRFINQVPPVIPGKIPHLVAFGFRPQRGIGMY